MRIVVVAANKAVPRCKRRQMHSFETEAHIANLKRWLIAQLPQIPIDLAMHIANEDHPISDEGVNYKLPGVSAKNQRI